MSITSTTTTSHASASHHGSRVRRPARNLHSPQQQPPQPQRTRNAVMFSMSTAAQQWVDSYYASFTTTTPLLVPQLRPLTMECGTDEEEEEDDDDR
ncbi:hypothetical protein ACA910_016472 [Epithemia clementina (nom. ined.)]